MTQPNHNPWMDPTHVHLWVHGTWSTLKPAMPKLVTLDQTVWTCIELPEIFRSWILPLETGDSGYSSSLVTVQNLIALGQTVCLYLGAPELRPLGVLRSLPVTRSDAVRSGSSVSSPVNQRRYWPRIAQFSYLTWRACHLWNVLPSELSCIDSAETTRMTDAVKSLMTYRPIST